MWGFFDLPQKVIVAKFWRHSKQIHFFVLLRIWPIEGFSLSFNPIDHSISEPVPWVIVFHIHMAMASLNC